MTTIGLKCLSKECAHECDIYGFKVNVQGSEIIKRFQDIPPELEKHFSDTFVSYRATGLKIDPYCLKSSDNPSNLKFHPTCQHKCRITYKDGSVVEKYLWGKTIVDLFYHLLSETGRNHFAYIRPIDGSFTIDASAQ